MLMLWIRNYVDRPVNYNEIRQLQVVVLTGNGRE